MKAIRLALAFIRMPRLFATLLLWPLVAGILASVTQVVLTSIYMRFGEESVEDYKERVATEDGSILWLKKQLYKNKTLPEAPIVCRWSEVFGTETPPTDCSVEPLDVAIQVENPSSYDVEEYQDFFAGVVKHLHICRNCSADITMNTTEGEVVSHINSLPALGAYVLTEDSHDKKVNQNFVAAKVTIKRLKELAGTVYFHPPGFKNPLNISQASFVMILVMNVSFLIIITLFLSLVGHRKVLQYFARNDALLPLVAACGKSEFYAAIWLITLLRVGFFLGTSLPLTYYILLNSVSEDTMAAFTGNPADFPLWVGGIICSLSALTIIASISELKQRHTFFSILYKIVPVLLVLIGTIVWSFTLFYQGSASTFIQSMTFALPLIGLSPIILWPLFKTSSTLILIHTILSGILVVIMLKLNSRWFAAHLEEI